MTSDEDLMDAITCRDASDAWKATLENFKARAIRDDAIGERLRREARDLDSQAEEHFKRSQEFHNLVRAMERAPLTFPSPT